MRIGILLGLALALAACGDKPAQRDGADNRAAEGEVLGGTISDDMLPLEQVQSQSPAMKVAPATDAGAVDDAGAGEDAEDGAGDAAPDADPATPDAAAGDGEG